MKKTFGKIEIFMGPMFSGKTKSLIERIEYYSREEKLRCYAAKYFGDNRYGNENEIRTHEGTFYRPAYPHSHLKEIINVSKNYDLVAIDEGNFFHDIEQGAEEMANNGKLVLISILSGSHQRKEFGAVNKLISLADHITFLHADCTICRVNKAPFTIKHSNLELLFDVGKNDKYTSVCRACYFNELNKRGEHA